MGKNKKQFIDKKTASVYHVVRRSQRDVGTEATSETLSNFVLMPSPENERVASRVGAASSTSKALQSSSASTTTTSKQKKSNNKVEDVFNTLKSNISTLAPHISDTQSSTYTKYTKPISNTSPYIPSNILHQEDATNLSTLFTDTSRNELDTALNEAMKVHEVGRMLDSIALTADCMEDDMERVLFGMYDENEFEEILDDFCLVANSEVILLDDDDDTNEGGDTTDEKGVFNYEQHIQSLMEKARAREAGEYEGGRRMNSEDEEDDFFGGVVPLSGKIEEEEEGEDEFDYNQYGQEEEEEDEEEDDDEEDSLDIEFNGIDDNDDAAVVVENNNDSDEQQRILCQKFEEALLEYDSDEVGDLDEECEEIVGDMPLEGDVQLEAALDEFLTEKQDDILIEGKSHYHMKNGDGTTKKRTGGSGYSALVGTTMVNATDLEDQDPTRSTKALLRNIEQSKLQMANDLADADAILANPEMDLPPEEILIDGKSYFTETSRSQWDCESILSTYSNLDNNPVVIGRRRGKKQRGGGKNKKKGSDMNNQQDVIPEEGPVKIQLSSKTGLPLGVFDYDNNNNNPSPEDGDEDHYDDDGYYNEESDTYLSINRGEARNKDETKFEKKHRKVAIKEERKICRMQKKIMKEAFKDEFMKRGQDVVANDVGGNTVFRF